MVPVVLVSGKDPTVSSQTLGWTSGWGEQVYFLLCSIHVHSCLCQSCLIQTLPFQSLSCCSVSLYGWWTGYSEQKRRIHSVIHAKNLKSWSFLQEKFAVNSRFSPRDVWWAECQQRMGSEESPLDDPLGRTGFSSPTCFSPFSLDKVWCWWNNRIQVSSSKTPHPDHPRPLMERKEWKNLNGAFF